ncbi:hypothetical protein SLEP1_g18760 [Rubroshorea leprosula]|uniref:Uncharacterized protein n=1 Tax=Rubroshorea leprosula TaxID=152421 RepID=A0AAV5J990_9ROSI|nr:hypothetical protein SLEP1_g18760 [Rubroshorea leprosula]
MKDGSMPYSIYYMISRNFQICSPFLFPSVCEFLLVGGAIFWAFSVREFPAACHQLLLLLAKSGSCWKILV